MNGEQHGAARRADGRPRRRPAVVRLVRLQRRLRGDRRRPRRQRLHRHQHRRRRRDDHLGPRQLRAHAQGQRRRGRLRRRRRPGRDHPGLGLRHAGRRAHHRPRGRRPVLQRHAPAGPLPRRRRARRLRRPRRRRHVRRHRDRHLRLDARSRPPTPACSTATRSSSSPRSSRSARPSCTRPSARSSSSRSSTSCSASGSSRRPRRWASTCPSTARPPIRCDARGRSTATRRHECSPPAVRRLLSTAAGSVPLRSTAVNQPARPDAAQRRPRCTTRGSSTTRAGSGSSRTPAGGRASGSCRWPWPGWRRSAIAARSARTASRATAPGSRCRSTGRSCELTWRGDRAAGAARRRVAVPATRPRRRARAPARSSRRVFAEAGLAVVAWRRRAVRRRPRWVPRPRIAPGRSPRRSSAGRPRAADDAATRHRRRLRAPAGRRPAAARDGRPGRRRRRSPSCRSRRPRRGRSSTRASSPAAGCRTSTRTCGRRCRVDYAVFHQRYATNTHPVWRLAQPFRSIAHNGEINTVRGNREQVRGRAARRRRLPRSPRELLAAGPLLSPDGSDSLSLDEALELLTTTGWELTPALLTAIPEALGPAPRAASARRHAPPPDRRLPRAVGRPGGDRLRRRPARSARWSTATACDRRPSR